MEPKHIDLGDVFHVKYPRWKHEENSVRGCEEAKRDHFDSIDFDTQWCLTLGMCTHWLFPMLDDDFVDPEGKISPHKPFSHLAYEEVQRLVTRHGDYHIFTIEHMVKEAHARDLAQRVEAKSATAHRWNLEALVNFRDFTKSIGARTVMATLTNYPYSATFLRNARRVGFDTRDLGNG